MDRGIPRGPNVGAPPNLPPTTPISANNPPNPAQPRSNVSGGPPTFSSSSTAPPPAAQEGSATTPNDDSNAPWIRILTTLWNRRESLRQRVADRKTEKERLTLELMGGQRLVGTIRAQTQPSIAKLNMEFCNIFDGLNSDLNLTHQKMTNQVKEQLDELSGALSDIAQKQTELIRKVKAGKGSSVPGGSGRPNQCSSSSAEGTSRRTGSNPPSVDLEVVKSTLEDFKKEFKENLDKFFSRVLCPPGGPPVGEEAGERENANDGGADADVSTGGAGDVMDVEEVPSTNGDGQDDSTTRVTPGSQIEVDLPKEGDADGEEPTSTSGGNNNSVGDGDGGHASANDGVADVLEMIGGGDDTSTNNENSSATDGSLSDDKNVNQRNKSRSEEDSDYEATTEEDTEIDTSLSLDNEEEDLSTPSQTPSPTSSSVEPEGLRRSRRVAAAGAMARQLERLPKTRDGKRARPTSQLKINRKKKKSTRAAAAVARTRLEMLYLEEDGEGDQ